MAIFASTTTSGYSDPLKAMSIKALEQRQKDMLAQQAAQQPDAAMMGTIPGGIGHVLGQIGDRMQQSRTDQALVAQKDALARAMSGYDVAGDAPPPSSIASLDPAMYKDMVQTWAENRRAKQAQEASAAEHAATRAHGSKESQLTREQQTALATQQQTHSSTESGLTRAQQAELAAAADARARELATQGQTHAATLAADADKRARDLQAERLAADAALEQKKLDAAAATRATDPKRLEAVETSETDYRKGLSHIENLEEATKILQHPGGIYTGALQTIAPTASGIPGASMFVDKEKAQRTSRFNTIVGEDAIRDMAQTLKGSSTNFEMQKFEKMKNDPNISDKQRADQLQRVVKAARVDLESQGKKTQAIGGDTARIDKAMGGGGAAPVDPLEGKTATGENGEKIIRRGGKWVPNG